MKIYQVDAFADKVFKGNPAAVCVIDEWPSDDLMQSIAEENNLAETAFVVKNNDRFDIRWFTPTVEVDLCGHATLAAAYVLFNRLSYPESTITFYSHRSGILKASSHDDIIYLDFPIDKYQRVEGTLIEQIEECIAVKSLAIYRGKSDFMAVVDPESFGQIIPDFALIKKLQARGLIVTAMHSEVDFVSRFFAPQSGIPEDSVTGSAHTTLIPYWAGVLRKNKLTAQQLSSRGGELHCELKNDRCLIGGKAAIYLEGEIFT